MDDKEPFLSRWSRRKLEAKQEAPAGAAQGAELPAAAPAAPLAPTTRPSAPETSQGISSEYREFFDPRVDEKLRRTALKKLFSDPRFNAMDGLDTYIDDYSKPDPIPEAMLRQLNQAKALLLFEEETKPDAGARDGSKVAGEAALASPAAPADTSGLLEPAPASASDEAAGAATSAAAAALGESVRHD